MKFIYQYRTRDNVEHQDVVRAADREAAFSALKARGIKPGRMWEAPGLFNKVFGKGKRWIAIATLLAVTAVSWWMLVTVETRVENRLATETGAVPRHFVSVGDLDLRRIFPDAGSCFLASFALPGKRFEGIATVSAEELRQCLEIVDEIKSVDSVQAVELKRIVRGMKDELRQYLKNGFGTPESYIVRLEERQAMESTYREQLLKRWQAGFLGKDEANSILLSMGLEPIE